jgi:serine-type D-Ala-D-Ala carboxypeptidase/endopeptidase
MNRALFAVLSLFTIPLAATPPPGFQAAISHAASALPGGIAAAWVDADGTVFAQAGNYSTDDPRPLSADSVFEVGSVSKVFTALLLSETERAGRVSRNDPVALHLLPEGDPDRQRTAGITLLSLATHTSGLPRLPVNIGSTPDSNSDPYAQYTRAQLVEALRQHGPHATQGSFAYSNFGAALLAEALGASWGASYEEALQKHVIEPMGLGATTLGINGRKPSDSLATPHVGSKAVPAWTFQAFAGAGAVRSTPRDMAHFVNVFLHPDDSPLRASLLAMQAPQAETDAGGHVGLGWMLNDDSPPVYAWHNGATAGSHAFVAFCPSRKVGIVLLANVQVPLEDLGWSLLGAPAPHRPVEAVAEASGYVGRYRLSSSFAIDITTDGTGLFLQATGQPQLALKGNGPDRFAVMGVPAEITFERDSSHTVTALVLHQNGMTPRGLRESLPAPPVEVVLDAATLKGYAGSYNLTPTFAIVVTVDDGKLFAQATGQARLRVYASKKDEFFYTVVNAQLSFTRDSSGLVNGLVLHQAGRDIPAQKAP